VARVPAGTVEIEDHGDVDLIRLVGEHDMATRDDVWVAVARSIESDRGVIVSLAEATFIDSGTINTLFKGDRMSRARDRRLVVHVGTPSVVHRALELTGVCASLSCAEDIETALVLAAKPGSDPSSTTA
jgi:anti-anti-sigma factor